MFQTGSRHPEERRAGPAGVRLVGSLGIVPGASGFRATLDGDITWGAQSTWVTMT